MSKVCMFCNGREQCMYSSPDECPIVREEMVTSTRSIREGQEGTSGEGCKEDVVNEPSHYKHGKYEVIDEMIIVFGPQKTYDFCIMNAWKYRARAPYKGKPEQDMDKANRYLEMAKQIAEANKELMYGCAPIRLIKYDGDKEKKVSANTYEAGLVDGYRGRMADEAAFLERSTHGSGR